MIKKQVENLETLKEQFDYFLFEMDDSLAALRTDVAALNQPELLQLDYSFESLDRLERMYALVLEGKTSIQLEMDLFVTRLARYIGETLRKQVGGKWNFCQQPKDINYGKPCLTQIPKLPKTYCFYPLVAVAGYCSSKRPGWLRKMVERNDIELMRKRFAHFLAQVDNEIESLSSYIKSLALPNALSLDYSFESLNGVEQVLAMALDGSVTPPATGVAGLVEQIGVYTGEVYRRHAGGEWQLCEDPRDIDFGLPRIGFYCPQQIVENYRVHRKTGLLYQATKSFLDGALVSSR